MYSLTPIFVEQLNFHAFLPILILSLPLLHFLLDVFIHYFPEADIMQEHRSHGLIRHGRSKLEAA